MKLLLLDMDGTVRRPITPDARFINSPKDQEIIPEAAEAITKYSDWTIIGITNQGGVAAGHKSLQDAIEEQHFTLKLCPNITAIYFCPDYDGNECWYVHSKFESAKQIAVAKLKETYRKPKPGMLVHAINAYQHGFRWEKILYVGDREEDVQAAAAADVPFMWAHEWHKGTGSIWHKGVATPVVNEV